MAIKKIEMRPESGNYNDILYPKTSTDMVVNTTGETLNVTLSSFLQFLNSLENNISIHKQDGSNPHGVSKSQVGLGNVTNERQLPLSGGQLTGLTKAQSNNTYTTPQIRNIIMSTGNPTGGNNGDIWFKYE